MLSLDTHIVLYALSDQLTRSEKSLLAKEQWSISAIVLWEIAKLAHLGRIEEDLDDPELIQILSGIQTWPITLDICRGIRSLDFRGDPADEIIAATSLVQRVPLLTRDKRMRRSKIVPLAVG